MAHLINDLFRATVHVIHDLVELFPLFQLGVQDVHGFSERNP
jgi:hypothetical protein